MTTTERWPMAVRLLILTPATAFSEQLRSALLARLPDLTIHIAADTVAALPLAASVDAILTVGSALSDELLKAAIRLRWIQSLGTGVDGIIDRRDLAPEVSVTNARGLFDDAVSECGIALMLTLARDIPRIVKNQTLQRWEYWTPRLLSGKSVGIVGLGGIGTALGRKCQAMGMRVIGISNRREAPGTDVVCTYDRLTEVASELHFLVLTASLNEQTRGLVNRKLLTALRRDACLINLGRGAMIIESDLLQALSDGTIAGAALDAFTSEPLPPAHPFWTAPHLVISPHLAGPNDTHVARILDIIEANILHLRAGRPATDLVNLVPRH